MAPGLWLIDRKGRRLGPYSDQLLRQAAARQSLRPDDLLQRKGETQWRRADEIPGLLPAMADTAAVTAAMAGDATAAHAAAGADAGGTAPRARRFRQTPAAVESTHYFLQHWRGELPLSVSYWINGVGVGAATGLLLALAASASSAAHLTIEASGRRILELLGATLLISVWQYVGIWRSAGHHVAAGGRSRWAVAARIAAALSFLQIAALTLRQMPTIHEALELASGHDRVPPADIRVVNGSTEVEISGGLSFGTADRLQAVLEATPSVRTVQLNNAGGWIAEGKSLGDLIARRGLATFTPRECDSACLLAFMGGSPRYIGTHARLGFHEASIAGVGGAVAAVGTEQMRRRFRSKGIPDAFIERALATPASSIWYPTADELLTAHVIDGVVDERQYATTGVRNWQDPAKLEADFLEVPIFAALKRAEPAIYQRLEVIWITGIQDGTPQSEMTARAHDIMIKDVIPKYLRQGADTALLAYWKSELGIARELRDHDAKACIGFMFPGVAGTRRSGMDQVSDEARAAEQRSLVRLLDATRIDPESPPAEGAVRDSLREVMTGTERQAPGSLKLLASPAQSARDPTSLCQAALAFYGTVTELPVDQAAAVMRYLASRSGNASG